jgi:hypothetical protein
LKNVNGIIFCIIFAPIFIRSFNGISAPYKNQNRQMGQIIGQCAETYRRTKEKRRNDQTKKCAFVESGFGGSL